MISLITCMINGKQAVWSALFPVISHITCRFKLTFVNSFGQSIQVFCTAKLYVKRDTLWTSFNFFTPVHFFILIIVFWNLLNRFNQMITFASRFNEKKSTMVDFANVFSKGVMIDKERVFVDDQLGVLWLNLNFVLICFLWKCLVSLRKDVVLFWEYKTFFVL